MICDNCGKQKASVHLTEVVNDQVTKLNLCEYCAKKKGSEMEQNFGIADLLQGLAEHGDMKVKSTVQKVKCVQCGMTFDEFKKIGRLGCAFCYPTFDEHLSPLLRRIHSSNQHTGKKPKRIVPLGSKKAQAPTKTQVSAKLTAEIALLKTKLKKSISDELYEDAAQIRDKIKELQSKQKKGS